MTNNHTTKNNTINFNKYIDIISNGNYGSVETYYVMCGIMTCGLIRKAINLMYHNGIHNEIRVDKRNLIYCNNDVENEFKRLLQLTQENHKFCDDIVNNEGMDHFNDDDMYDITHNFSYIHHYCIIHIYNIFRGKKMGYLLNKIMNGKLSNELHPFNKDIFECIELSISSSISSLKHIIDRYKKVFGDIDTLNPDNKEYLKNVEFFKDKVIKIISNTSSNNDIDNKNIHTVTDCNEKLSDKEKIDVIRKILTGEYHLVTDKYLLINECIKLI